MYPIPPPIPVGANRFATPPGDPSQIYRNGNFPVVGPDEGGSQPSPFNPGFQPPHGIGGQQLQQNLPNNIQALLAALKQPRSAIMMPNSPVPRASKAPSLSQMRAAMTQLHMQQMVHRLQAHSDHHASRFQ